MMTVSTDQWPDAARAVKEGFSLVGGSFAKATSKRTGLGRTAFAARSRSAAFSFAQALNLSSNSTGTLASFTLTWSQQSRSSTSLFREDILHLWSR